MQRRGGSDENWQTEQSPEISVVVPTYNRTSLLLRCLSSLESQTLDPELYEVVVVDDGSENGTSEAVAGFLHESRITVRYVLLEHGGPAKARNRGIERAVGAIVAFTDDDCIADQDWLKNIREAFQDSGVAAVEGRVVASGSTSPLMHVVRNDSGGQYLTANIAFRTEVLKVIGGFDGSFPHPVGEDYDLAWRLLDAGHGITFCSQAVVSHPTHYESLKAALQNLVKWKSIAYLALKHPASFRRVKGSGLTRHLLFYAFAFPGVELSRHLGFFVTNPAKLFNWLARRFGSTVYCLFLAVFAQLPVPRGRKWLH